MAYAEAQVGTASTRQTRSDHGADVPQKIPQCDTLLNDLGNRLSASAQTIYELEKAATRLAGNVPANETESGDKVSPGTPSVLQRLDYAVQHATRIQERLAELLRRFQAAV